MNETIKTLLERRSVRTYSDKLVPDNVLKEILKAGTYAPSGMGKQSAKIVLIKNKEVRDKVAKLNAAVMGRDADPFYGAPYVAVVFADKNVMTYLYDGSLVMGNLLNAAYSLGVDSCWIHRAKEVFESAEGKALMKEWGLSQDYEGIGNCILGYRKEDSPEIKAKERKEDFVTVIE